MLSLDEINELVAKLPQTYIPVNGNAQKPICLNKKDLFKNNLKLALRVGNFKVVEFIKMNDTTVDKICFIDLGKKIVVFDSCLFLNILKIGTTNYFIMDDTNWYGGQLSVYKLNEANFDLVKRDGYSKD